MNLLLFHKPRKMLKNGGFWQFPRIEKSTDGIIHISFHIHPDSRKSYGESNAHYLSYDNGTSWKQVENFDGFGQTVANGDAIEPFVKPAIPVGQLELPKPIGFYQSPYNNQQINIYNLDEMPQEVQGSYIKRKKSGCDEFEIEKINIAPCNLTKTDTEDVIPITFFFRLRKLPHNQLCGMLYSRRVENSEVYKYSAAQFFISNDYGYNWKLASEIKYSACPGFDEFNKICLGYSEPDITCLPDGSYFTLLRTTVGQNFGPLMYSRSSDNMKTWSAPKYFDKLGVWPELLTLGNGVTLASYGRPGVFLRATSDPAAQKWDDPLVIVEPIYEHPQKNTCSYTGMVAIDDNNFLLVYSKFDYPDENNVKRKTILVRKIKIEIL